MSKIKSVLATYAEGSVGDLTLYDRKGVMCMRSKPGPNKSNTPKQCAHRIQFGEVVGCYRAISPMFNFSFEKETPGQTMYNLVTKYNVGVDDFYMTKQELEIGTQVLPHLMVSRGSVQTIEVQETDSDYVFEIGLGDLVIDGSTTVWQFSNALVQNSMFEYGERLTILECEQELATEFAPAHILTRVGQLTLVPRENHVRLYDVFPANLLHTATLTDADGASANFLSMPKRDYFMYTMIRSRYTDGRLVRCSTQRLVGRNPLLARYQGKGPMLEAIESYGPTTAVNHYAPDTVEETTKKIQRFASDKGSTGSGTGNTDPTDTERVTLSCSVLGSGGTVAPTEKTVAKGTSVTFTATPDQGKRVKQWSTGATGNTLTVTATKNASYTVSFEADSGASGDTVDM